MEFAFDLAQLRFFLSFFFPSESWNLSSCFLHATTIQNDDAACLQWIVETFLYFTCPLYHGVYSPS